MINIYIYCKIVQKVQMKNVKKDRPNNLYTRVVSSKL